MLNITHSFSDTELSRKGELFCMEETAEYGCSNGRNFLNFVS